MHSYLKAVGFSKIKKRTEMKEIILDVIKNYDEKNVVEDHPDGVFAQFSRFYGNDCGITVCGQYDDDNRFHVEYYYPFFRGTGITTQEQVTVERHADKDAFSAACDDLRIGITLIFYLQNKNIFYPLLKTQHPDLISAYLFVYFFFYLFCN